MPPVSKTHLHGLPAAVRCAQQSQATQGLRLADQQACNKAGSHRGVLISEWKQSQKAGHESAAAQAGTGAAVQQRHAYPRLQYRWLPAYLYALHLRAGGGAPSQPARASAARSAASCGCNSGLTEMAPSKKLRTSEAVVLEMPLTLPLNLTSGRLLGNSMRRSWQLVPSMTRSWPSSWSQPAACTA